jgi:AraC-like DNA-binding protein
MGDIFAMAEGQFGKVVVIELCHSLVPHSHPEIQFSYWLAGGQCNGRVGEASASCSESQAMVINRYQAHDAELMQAHLPATLLVVYLNEEWFDQHFSNQFGPIHFQLGQLTHTSEMRSKSWELMQKILFVNDRDMASIQEDVQALIRLTLDNNPHLAVPKTNANRRKMLDYRLRLALTHLSDNMTEQGLMKNLSKSVGVSRSRLYELFKKELQSTPKLIWNSVLIEAVVHHLAQPEMDLSRISEKLGFSTAANFSRFFRGHKGVTPTTYKKQIKIR